MAFNVSNFPTYPTQIGFSASNISVTTANVVVGSTVFRTSGNATGVRFASPVTGTLSHVYMYCTDKTATPTCTVTIYSNDAASVSPNTPAVGSTAAGTAVATQWVKFSNVNASLVTGRNYWVFLGNAADVAVNPAYFLIASPIGTIPSNAFTDFGQYSSTNGGATMTSVPSASARALCVLEFSDGSVYGCPYTTNTADASSTLERGNVITGLANDLLVCGVSLGAGTLVGDATGIKIYSSAAGPGSATLLSLTFPDGSDSFKSAAALRDFRFDPITLAAGGTYVVSLTYDSVSTAPGYYSILDYNRFTAVQNCAYGGNSKMYRVIDDGAGGWTSDTSAIEKIGLLINPSYTQSGTTATRPWSGRPSGIYRP